MKSIALIEAFTGNTNTYTINGVKYTVESRFVPYELKGKQTTFGDKIKRVIKSDFIPLTADTDDNILDTDNVYATVGKEDYAVE